jgi:hypothetical protein
MVIVYCVVFAVLSVFLQRRLSRSLYAAFPSTTCKSTLDLIPYATCTTSTLRNQISILLPDSYQPFLAISPP